MRSFKAEKTSSSDPTEKLICAIEEAAGGAFLLFGGGTLATGLGALYSIIIARLLGPELYGVYSLAFIVPGFLILFTDFGVGPALTRYIAYHTARSEESRVKSIMRTGLSFSLLTSIIVSIAGFFSASQLTRILLNRPNMLLLVSISIPLVFFQSFSAAAKCSLLGFNDMKNYAILDVVCQASRLLLGPTLILAGLSILGAFGGHVSAYMIVFILSVILIYRHYRRLKSDPNGNRENSFLENLKLMIGYGSPLYLSTTLQNILATVRGIILAYFATNLLIGNFNTALNFAVLAVLISSPISNALFPAFSKLSDNHEEARKMFTYAVKYTSTLIVPAAIFIATMSKDLVFFIYGPKYTSAPKYLTLYILNFLYASLGSIVLPSFFNGLGDTKVNLKASVIYAATFIPSAVILTYLLNVEGLLTATLVSTATSTIYSLQAAIKKYNAKPDLKNSATICASSALSATPLIPLILYSSLPNLANLTIGAILYALTYLTLAPILKAINQQDLQTLTKILTKNKPLKPIINIIASYENRILKVFPTKK